MVGAGHLGAAVRPLASALGSPRNSLNVLTLAKISKHILMLCYSKPVPTTVVKSSDPMLCYSKPVPTTVVKSSDLMLCYSKPVAATFVKSNDPMLCYSIVNPLPRGLFKVTLCKVPAHPCDR